MSSRQALRPGRRPGHHSASRGRLRPDVTAVLAVLLPALTLLAAVLVDPDVVTEPLRPPGLAGLTSATVICPAALPGAGTTYLSTGQDDVRGPVSVGLGSDLGRAALRSGRVTEVDRGDRPLVITAEGELAPGLVAARLGTSPLSAVACPATSPDQWFTGVGAGAGHTSVLELVNPDAGPAVADVRVHGRGGVVDVPGLRGLAVPGGGSVRVELGDVVPRRDELALQVTTSRGRLAATVVDRRVEVEAGITAEEWLPAQAAPELGNVLLGLPDGKGRHALVLANPGDDEVRTRIRLVTTDSVFAPAGLDEVRVAPGSVVRVPLAGVLASPSAEGALGVVVDSGTPVTATLRSVVDGDLSHAVAGTPISTATTSLVPEGRKELVLAGADDDGMVSVVARSAAGRRLLSARREISPDRGVVIELPRRATLLSVTPRQTSLIGASLVSGDGAAVVRLTELVREGLVPDVRPGLP